MPDPEQKKDAQPDTDDVAAPAEDPLHLGDSRRLYRERYADMNQDDRIALAKTADVDVMRALAFDPVPRVISALMENPNFSTAEARTIAREHANPVGLGMLTAIPRLLADAEVRRRLLRNPHSTQQIMGALLRGKPLLSIYQVSMSHDVPENSKTFARSELRRAFASRDPEEKVMLIFKTEGRVLSLVVGIALDGRAISMIVGRTAMGATLVRSFAQWPSTPPPILAHMMKLPQVQRDKSLLQVLMRHPNLPSQFKR